MKKLVVIVLSILMISLSACKKEEPEEIVEQEFSDGLIHITLDSSFQEVNVMGTDYTLKNDDVTVVAHAYSKQQLADIGYGNMDLNSFVGELVSGDEAAILESYDGYKAFSYYGLYDGVSSFITIAGLESENYLASVSIICNEHEQGEFQQKMADWIRSAYLKEE